MCRYLHFCITYNHIHTNEMTKYAHDRQGGVFIKLVSKAMHALKVNERPRVLHMRHAETIPGSQFDNV